MKTKIAWALGLAMSASIAIAQAPQVLEGTITGAQNHTYVEVPFRVPAGIARVTIQYAYTGKKERTTIDLGLEDPTRVRCWSGGNKHVLTVALSDATPSCEPGALPSGTWNVLLGVPNIRANVTSHYTINVWLSKSPALADEPAILREPLRSGPAWYRGDLHLHTAHSDGSCPSISGKNVPCPVFVMAETAEQRGLDFIAISDHNATSQYNSMREIQPYFDNLLLIPGREITTFYGHLNLIGATQYVNWRLGSKAVPDINTLVRAMDATGAVTSVNHPNDPSGENCMGCGFTPPTTPDLSLFTAVEIVNGTNAGPNSGISFWEDALNRGIRLTAIGGSDTHRPLSHEPVRVGMPTTVIYANDLSTQSILAGIRAAHVFLDVKGTRNRGMEMSASTQNKTVQMGDSLDAASGSAVDFTVTTHNVDGATIALLADGKQIATGTTAVLHSAWKSDGKRHWIRANVLGPDGDLWLIGNPIFINWSAHASN